MSDFEVGNDDVGAMDDDVGARAGKRGARQWKGAVAQLRMGEGQGDMFMSLGANADIAAGASGTFTEEAIDHFYAERGILDGSAGTAGLAITEIKTSGNSRQASKSGDMPASMFQKDAVSPFALGLIRRGTTISCTVKNPTAATAASDISVGFYGTRATGNLT